MEMGPPVKTTAPAAFRYARSSDNTSPVAGVPGARRISNDRVRDSTPGGKVTVVSSATLPSTRCRRMWTRLKSTRSAKALLPASCGNTVLKLNPRANRGAMSRVCGAVGSLPQLSNTSTNAAPTEASRRKSVASATPAKSG